MRIISFFFIALIFTGCEKFNVFLNKNVFRYIEMPYNKIIQGNFISQESASRIQIGMSKKKVIELFGHPILQQDLSKNNLIYMFYIKNNYLSDIIKYKFIITFNNNFVIKWSKFTELPLESDFFKKNFYK